MWSAHAAPSRSSRVARIEIPVESIHCHPITPSGILRASIAEHGILQPLVLAEGGDGYVVLEGRQRFHVAREFGMATVPAVCVELPADARRELARWNPELSVPGKSENMRVEAILEEARRRGLITTEDLPRLRDLNELSVVAALKEIWRQRQPENPPRSA